MFDLRQFGTDQVAPTIRMQKFSMERAGLATDIALGLIAASGQTICRRGQRERDTWVDIVEVTHIVQGNFGTATCAAVRTEKQIAIPAINAQQLDHPQAEIVSQSSKRLFPSNSAVCGSVQVGDERVLVHNAYGDFFISMRPYVIRKSPSAGKSVDLVRRQPASGCVCTLGGDEEADSYHDFQGIESSK